MAKTTHSAVKPVLPAVWYSFGVATAELVTVSQAIDEPLVKYTYERWSGWERLACRGRLLRTCLRG